MPDGYGYQITNQDGNRIATAIVYGTGENLSIPGDHPSFEQVKAALLAELPLDEILDTFSTARAIQRRFEPLTDRIAVRDDKLYFDGDEMHGALATQVVRFTRESVEDVTPLLNFIERLGNNPGEAFVRDQAYRWIQSARLDITPEGFIVGYKGVRTRDEDNEDGYLYESTSSGHGIVDGIEYIDANLPQSVGSVVTMPRSEVDFDPKSDCSVGLHVGTRSYARSYGDTTTRVLVDPKDIVSVPAYSDEKMRVCRYIVDGIEEREQDEPAFAGPVYEPSADFDSEADAYAQENTPQTVLAKYEGKPQWENRKTSRLYVQTYKKLGVLNLVPADGNGPARKYTEKSVKKSYKPAE